RRGDRTEESAYPLQQAVARLLTDRDELSRRLLKGDLLLYQARILLGEEGVSLSKGILDRSLFRFQPLRFGRQLLLQISPLGLQPLRFGRQLLRLGRQPLFQPSL